MFVSGGKWPLSASDQCGHQKVRAIHFCGGKKKKSWRASRAARPQAADLLSPRGGRGGEDGRRDSVGFYRVGL